MEQTRLRIDVKDVEIVRMLQSSGRASFKEIASAVHLSIPAVRTRVRRLEELGVIKGYIALVDPERILDRVRVLLLMRVPPEKQAMVAEVLAASQEVRELHYVAGRYNLVAKLELRSVEALHGFTSRYLKSISSYEHLIITSSPKEEYGSLLNPNDVLKIRCDFCKAPIVENPIIEYIGGGRYYFSSRECAEAFKERMLRKEKNLKESFSNSS